MKVNSEIEILSSNSAESASGSEDDTTEGSLEGEGEGHECSEEEEEDEAMSALQDFMRVANASNRTARSTVLNHTIPPFYAVYLLRSFSPKFTKRTNQELGIYIGSTPDPAKRIRQHNGLLTQGASETLRRRPWEMELIVHGFPSKLQALQFEWAWQNHYKSRHLRSIEPEQEPNAVAPLKTVSKSTVAQFPKRKGVTHSPILKIQVVQFMLCVAPWNAFKLEVVLFSPDAKVWWEEAKSRGVVMRTSAEQKALDKRNQKLLLIKDGKHSRGKSKTEVEREATASDVVSPTRIQEDAMKIFLQNGLKRISVTERFEGVDGARQEREQVREELAQSNDEKMTKLASRRASEAALNDIGRLVADDGAFFEPHWEKWLSIIEKSSHQTGKAKVASLRCTLCDEPVEVNNHIDFMLCTGADHCHALFHPVCLSQHFLPSPITDSASVAPDQTSSESSIELFPEEPSLPELIVPELLLPDQPPELNKIDLRDLEGKGMTSTEMTKYVLNLMKENKGDFSAINAKEISIRISNYLKTRKQAIVEHNKLVRAAKAEFKKASVVYTKYLKTMEKERKKAERERLCPTQLVLPTWGHCPKCEESIHWQDLVRASYRRADEAAGERKTAAREQSARAQSEREAIMAQILTDAEEHGHEIEDKVDVEDGSLAIWRGILYRKRLLKSKYGGKASVARKSVPRSVDAVGDGDNPPPLRTKNKKRRKTSNSPKKATTPVEAKEPNKDPERPLIDKQLSQDYEKDDIRATRQTKAQPFRDEVPISRDCTSKDGKNDRSSSGSPSTVSSLPDYPSHHSRVSTVSKGPGIRTLSLAKSWAGQVADSESCGLHRDGSVVAPLGERLNADFAKHSQVLYLDLSD